MPTARPLALVALALGACNNAPVDNDLYDGPAFGRVGGFVHDVDGQPLADVSVELDGLVAVTDAEGLYVLDGVTPGQDLVLEFTRPGYARGYARTALISWETVGVDKVLSPIDGRDSFVAFDGGVVEVADVTVAFMPDGIVTADGAPYEGTVNVEVTHIDPYSAELDAAPGDLTALALEDGSAKAEYRPNQLVSYGMVDVSLYDDDGNPLQLQEGMPATVEMPITNGDLPQLYHLGNGDTQKLWSFDRERGRWIEEGLGDVAANDEGDLTFTFEASHFSWWNCDQGFVPTCATGRVVDAIGFPVRGATLTARGGQSTSTVTTDEEGYYVVSVMAGDTVRFESSTFVGRRTWLETSPAIFIDGEGSSAADCEPIPDIEIEVCRESGVVMADDLNLHVSGMDVGQNGDQMRAWFWEPAGDPWLCESPWDRLEEEDCMETTPKDFPSHLGDDLPVMEDIHTRSVGEWLEMSTDRDTYVMEKEEINGLPKYSFKTLEIDDQGELVINDLDLRGGDAIGGRAPGSVTDYFGPLDAPALFTIPEEVRVTNMSGPQRAMSRSNGFSVNYNAGDNDWGMLVFVTSGPEDPSLVCRYRDDGSIRISGADMGRMNPGFASVSVYRPDFDWTAGPDGLPIRKQIVSGAIIEAELR
ncbi:MAG: hypothetical protein H6739_06680 [Alphaproteobacteria bacterium]|nr:hypothetical protein [Alphaproteobacteria bacterium]